MNSISPQMLGLPGQVTLLKGPGPGEGPTRAATLRRLLRLAIRWRWVLIGCVLAGAVAGVLATLLMPREYASTLRLQISRDAAQVVSVGAVSHDVSVGDQEFYQTQYGLLRAQALAERVAREIGVVDDPAFFRMFHKSDDFADNPGPSGRAKRNEIAGHVLLDHVDVAPIHGSSLVDVQARTPSPALSQKVAQTWGQAFVASNLERRLQPSAYASQFLETRLAQLRERMEASERRAADYAAANGIIDLPSTTANAPRSAIIDTSQARSLITDDLVAVNTAREGAAAESIKASAELAAFDKQPGASDLALQNRAISALRDDRAAAAADYARLSAQATPDDPAAKAARAQVDSLDAAIRSEENRIRASLQQTYQAAASREKALTQQVNALKGSLAELRQHSIQYAIYQRDAQTNRELYDALLQRYKEVGVAGAAESNNVAVVDEARAPDKPSSPRLSINLLLFTLAGAIIGAIAVAILDQLDEGAAGAAERALSPAALAEP